ncbi:MAG TPA: hypothetical protein VJ736_07380 [Actinomycetota bacterium]|nr:hypothetical protein [Actinomycetota bacterium]
MTLRHSRPWLFVLSLTLLAACDHYAATKGEAPPSLVPGPSPIGAAQHDPCFTPDPPSPITVSVVHRPDGTCWPLDREMVYRCDPSMPAVAEVDVGEGVRRFLGGSYAVRVSAVPPTALSEGVTPFGELFVDPSDPSFLWVRSDGVSERWLALPNRSKLADPPTVQMIGDSILDGGQTDVVAGLPDWTVTIDALIGRGSSGAAGVAEALPSPAADVVVIEIGVNDPDASITAANAERIISVQGGARLLVWLTAHGPEPQVPAVNEAIWDAIGPLPNGAVLDWDRLVPLDALSSDGIHPDAGRQGVLASIVDPYLQGWLDAVEGQGATACQGTIRSNL